MCAHHIEPLRLWTRPLKVGEPEHVVKRDDGRHACEPANGWCGQAGELAQPRVAPRRHVQVKPHGVDLERPRGAGHGKWLVDAAKRPTLMDADSPIVQRGSVLAALGEDMHMVDAMVSAETIDDVPGISLKGRRLGGYADATARRTGHRAPFVSATALRQMVLQFLCNSQQSPLLEVGQTTISRPARRSGQSPE